MALRNQEVRKEHHPQAKKKARTDNGAKAPAKVDMAKGTRGMVNVAKATKNSVRWKEQTQDGGMTGGLKVMIHTSRLQGALKK